tara:strand:- start:1533 stop:2183 length:651 start_codon:yes stop_codon:yes gene_type:complete
MKFYSELGDDRYVYENFFKFRSKPGIYLEAYAFDGIQNSSTKAFEEIGWKGILVEPVKETFDTLVSNRPKDQCVRCVLDNSEGYVTLANNTTERVKTNTLRNVIRNSGYKALDALFLNLQGTSTEYKVIESLGNIPVGVLCLRTSDSAVSQTAIHNLLKSKGYKLHQKFHNREIWTGNDLESFEMKRPLKACAKNNFLRVLAAFLAIHLISKIKVN